VENLGATESKCDNHGGRDSGVTGSNGKKKDSCHCRLKVKLAKKPGGEGNLFGFRTNEASQFFYCQNCPRGWETMHSDQGRSNGGSIRKRENEKKKGDRNQEILCRANLGRQWDWGGSVGPKLKSTYGERKNFKRRRIQKKLWKYTGRPRLLSRRMLHDGAVHIQRMTQWGGG